MMSAKLRASSDAPPTSAPSTSGWLISSLALFGFTLPPYWMRTFLAVASSNIFTSNAADERVRVLRLLRRRRLAGADGPDRFVGDDGFDHLLLGQTGEAAAHLRFQNFFHLAAFAFGQRFADADNRLERRRVRRRAFLAMSASDSF
jgi:hypothetical protein